MYTKTVYINKKIGIFKLRQNYTVQQKIKYLNKKIGVFKTTVALYLNINILALGANMYLSIGVNLYKSKKKSKNIVESI